MLKVLQVRRVLMSWVDIPRRRSGGKKQALDLLPKAWIGSYRKRRDEENKGEKSSRIRNILEESALRDFNGKLFSTVLES